MMGIAPPTSIPGLRSWIDGVIESSWLAAVVLVPLVFAPPGWFAFFETPRVALVRTLAAIIVSLWAVDITLVLWLSGRSALDGWRARLRLWLAVDPVRWLVVVASAFFAIAVVLSRAIGVLLR